MSEVCYIDNDAGSGTYTLLEPGRYTLTFRGYDLGPAYDAGKVNTDPVTGREWKNPTFQYVLKFAMSDPLHPDETFVDESGREILLTGWYNRRDDQKVTPKMDAYKVLAALNGVEKLDSGALGFDDLIGRRINAVIFHKPTADGSKVFMRISKGTEAPYAPPTARPMTRRAAAATATATAAAAPTLDEDSPF